MSFLRKIKEKLRSIPVFLWFWNTLCIWFRPIETESISLFVTEEQAVDETYMKALRTDIMRSKRLCGVTTAEYFLFHFEEKNRAERRQFLGLFDVTWRIEPKYNSAACRELFYNKYLTYLRFQKYYGRSMIHIRNAEDTPAYDAFRAEHDSFIVKPLSSEQGKGVYIVGSPEEQPSLEELLASGPCVIEELVRQAPELMAFHPNSVNTVRVLTICRNGNAKVLYTFLRVGCGGSVVDNANAGGIVSEIKMETGVICSNGFRENGRVFETHPDTGVRFEGTQIPRWEEMMMIARELALVEPRVSIMGWDMALTENGWVLVEGNDRPAFTAIQMIRQRGLRPDYERAMGECCSGA